MAPEERDQLRLAVLMKTEVSGGANPAVFTAQNISPDETTQTWHLFASDLPEAAALIAGDGRIASANLRFAELFASTAEALKGRALDSLFSAGLYSTISEALVKGKAYSRPVKTYDTAGCEMALRLSCCIAPSAGTGAIALILCRLGEQEALEEALKESERVYRAIGEAIDYGIWICDSQGRNTYASESLLKLLGISRDQCAEFGWGKVLHPDDAEATIAAWKECVKEGKNWYREHRYLGADGQWHPILACGIPVRDEKGRITCWAGINLDISRLKKTEEALREADRRKDRFLSMLAHELRNPMAAISVAAALLTRPDVSPEHARIAGDSLKLRVRQLGRLVDDLLDVARITTGKIQLRKSSLDLALVIKRAVESSKSLFKARSQRLRVELQEPLPVFGDPLRLEQIISNLLANASRYSEDGQESRLEARRDGAEVVVKVADQGIGIAPDLLPLLFETFMQADSSLARTRGGLGLGLSIVKSLCEMHNGSVTAKSEGEGRGSEFEVRLPLEATCEAVEPEGEQRKKLLPLRILIAEDHYDTAQMHGAMMQLEGYTVETARDGHEAVEKALRTKPDAILLDIGLPGLSGYEVAEKIRQAGMLDTYIIAVTGYGQEGDVRRARQAGINEHFLKPLEYEKILPLLARCGEQQKPER